MHTKLIKVDSICRSLNIFSTMIITTQAPWISRAEWGWGICHKRDDPFGIWVNQTTLYSTEGCGSVSMAPLPGNQ